MELRSTISGPDRTTRFDVLLGCIVAIGIALRFSCSLDDHDSCLFVAGVERFNIAEHRPHPPGYPIYILAGKMLTGLFATAESALAFLSVASAGIAAMLLPRLFRRMGASDVVSYVQSLVVIVTPCFWLTGSKVLTDMPGFAATLLLWIAHLKELDAPSRKTAFWLGVATGLACGVRAHVFLPMIPFLLRGPVWLRLAGTVVGFAVWYGGMALHQGVEAIVAATEKQAMMRFHEPNVSVFVGDGVWRRAVRFAKGFAEGSLGLAPWRSTLYFVAGCAVAYVSNWIRTSVSKGESIRTLIRTPRGMLFTAAACQCVFVFLFLPAHPRYFLAALPALAVALTFDRVAIGVLLTVVIGGFTFERARLLHEVPPAPFQAVQWMDRLDPAGNTPLLAGKMFAYAREAAPDRVESRGSWDPMVLPPPIAFFTDRRSIPDDLPGYRVSDSSTFERDEAVHDKDFSIRIRRFEPISTDSVTEAPPR